MMDLAVLGQDPRFGGGSRVQIDAFLEGARELGREPHLIFLAYHGLRGRPARAGSVTPLRATMPGLDGVNQSLAGRRTVPGLRSAGSVWVVAAVASHGYGAARSGRRYGVWAGTALEDEWSSRRGELPPSRRAALALSGPTLRRLERETLRRARRVYATSPSSRESLAAAGGLDVDAVGILPIPIDTEVFAPAPDAVWRASVEDAPTIAFVGRCDDPRKNVRLLLDAFARVRAALPAARLILAGPGGTADAGAAGVEVAGETPDVPALLRRATIFVLPSLQEGFGVVAAEALACGLPVVTTPSGGPEDLVARSGGGHVIGGFDADELAETLVELIRDPERLAAMRESGRAFVAREHAPSRFQKQLAAALGAVDGP